MSVTVDPDWQGTAALFGLSSMVCLFPIWIPFLDPSLCHMPGRFSSCIPLSEIFCPSRVSNPFLGPFLPLMLTPLYDPVTDAAAMSSPPPRGEHLAVGPRLKGAWGGAHSWSQCKPLRCVLLHFFLGVGPSFHPPPNRVRDARKD